MSFLANLHFGLTARYNATWEPPRDAAIPAPELDEAFAKEGIRLLGARFAKDRAQFLVEAAPTVAPTFLVQRIKGRWSRSLGRRDPGFPKFSRHFFLRTLGDNTREVVSNYVRSQVDRSDLVDPLYRERMKELRFINEEEALLEKTRHRGIYDLYAHVVLVTGGRYRMFSPEARRVFEALCEGVRTMGAEPMDISMMPDHGHLLLAWPSRLSAEELLDGIKRESGRVMKRTAFWNAGGYVGAVGPYRIRAAMEGNRRRGWVREAGGRIPGSG